MDPLDKFDQMEARVQRVIRDLQQQLHYAGFMHRVPQGGIEVQHLPRAKPKLRWSVAVRVGGTRFETMAPSPEEAVQKLLGLIARFCPV